MSLSQALATSVSGLRVTQAGLALVASNVANAETPGYIRKTMDQVALQTGGLGNAVRLGSINRELDQYIQRQLRTETSGGTYADMRAAFYQRIQQVYGDPGSSTSLETIFNNFTTSLQTLVTSPESSTAQREVLNSAQVLAQQLNNMSSDIQGIRTDAELGLSDAVGRANEAMQQIARINQQVGTMRTGDSTMAALLDQRDIYMTQLSQLMDVRTLENEYHQLSVFTNSGVQLVGLQASKLSFDPQGTMTPNATWSMDPSERNVGTIKLTSPTGGEIDLIANKAIRSGQIAALVEMRDQVLVQAQAQLDMVASAMSRALSDRNVNGTAVTSGAQSGYDIDIGGLATGNTINISYTDVSTNTLRRVTLVRVDDPSVLPLSGNVTSAANDRVVGIDFSSGLGFVVAQISAALGASGLQVSNTAGTTLRFLDDGGSNKVNLNALSSTQSATSLTGGTAELPLFTDAHSFYTGAIGTLGSQQIGYAGRITVNASLIADPSKLVQYASGIATGDATRPNFLYDKLNTAMLEYSPDTGIGTPAQPYSGTLPSFLRQIISQQGEAAASANNLAQGQGVVVQSLQERFNDSAGVNIDQEMAHLLNLQNSYAANARVLSAVKDMLDLLMQMR